MGQVHIHTGTVIAFKSDMRVAGAFASIIDDGRSGMSDLAFHAARPIGGLSCLASE